MRTITLNMVDREAYDENESGVAIESTVPAVVQVEAIRTYYRRKGGRVGTRLTFTDGGGFAVADTFEAVSAALAAAGVTIPAPLPLPVAEPAAELLPEAEATPVAEVAPARSRRRTAH
jgi:hypothetical protein